MIDALYQKKKTNKQKKKKRKARRAAVFCRIQTLQFEDFSERKKSAPSHFLISDYGLF